MTNMSKKELLMAIKPRYIKASKDERGLMLDEFCNNTGYNRKYAVRILAAGYDHNKVKRVGRKSRKKKYDNDFLATVVKIWELLEYPCGKRLKPNLVSTTEALIRHGELKVTSKTMIMLGQIGATTLDRRLKREREIRRLSRNRGTTRHGTLLKSSIPIRITNWNLDEVGNLETDTVAHNGGDPSGECVYTLDLVEIHSGWSEQQAVMGKGERGVVLAIDEMKATMPFMIKGLDSDNGSEFINWHLVKYCQKNSWFFTRSRPDRKNDNAYVEQKNRTHIRDWMGYGRYDTMEQKNLMNNLYRKELRLFNNFFRPVMKINTKEKVNNSVCKKTYDIAQTPYQRLINSSALTNEQQGELKTLYLSLNPMALKRAINEKLTKIRKTVK